LEKIINWDLAKDWCSPTSFLNPARGSTLKQNEISYFHYELLINIPLEHYSANLSLKEKGSIRVFYTKIDFSEPLGYKWINETKGINFSKSISKNFYLGINYKEYEVETCGLFGSGKGFDIGFLKKLNDKSLMQIALINLDTKIKYSSGVKEKTPEIIDINFSFEPFKNIPLKIMIRSKYFEEFKKDYWNFTTGRKIYFFEI
jgi:hypothetical protein